MMPTLQGGELDRVYVYNDQHEAQGDVDSWKSQGVEAVLVSRVLPYWEEVDGGA